MDHHRTPISRPARWMGSILFLTVMLAPTAPAVAEEPTFNIECDSIGEAGTSFVRGINCRWVDVDGYPREYIVYLPHAPAFDPEKETAVVFHYHGSGGRAEGTLTESEWALKAEDAHFVAVFGTGLTYFECTSPGCSTGGPSTKWHNSNLDCGFAVDCDFRHPGYPEDAPWPADDLQFTDKMLADVRHGLVVDPRRIYVSGFSNGGGMSLTLAVERSRVFAAAATAGPGATHEVFDPARNVPLYYAMGTRDGHIIDEINRAPDAPTPPLEEFPLTYEEGFAFSATRSRVDDVLETYGVSNVPDHVWEFRDELRILYRTPLSGVADGSEVVFSFQGGVGHEFANESENPEGFHNPDIFWKFFHDHPMKK